MDVQHKRRGRPRLRDRPTQIPQNIISSTSNGISSSDNHQQSQSSIRAKQQHSHPHQHTHPHQQYNPLSRREPHEIECSALISIPEINCVNATPELARQLHYPLSSIINRPFIDLLVSNDHIRFTNSVLEAVGSAGIWRSQIAYSLDVLKDNIKRQVTLGWFSFVKLGGNSGQRARCVANMGSINAEQFIMLSFKFDQKAPSSSYLTIDVSRTLQASTPRLSPYTPLKFSSPRSANFPSYFPMNATDARDSKLYDAKDSREPRSIRELFDIRNLHSQSSSVQPPLPSPSMSPTLSTTFDDNRYEFKMAIANRPPMVDLSMHGLKRFNHYRTPSGEKLPSLKELGI